MFHVHVEFKGQLCVVDFLFPSLYHTIKPRWPGLCDRPFTQRTTLLAP